MRAARDLARLWGEQGRRTEARDLVAPVYSWFTEGFDTADLKEAKALLSWRELLICVARMTASPVDSTIRWLGHGGRFRVDTGHLPFALQRF